MTYVVGAVIILFVIGVLGKAFKSIVSFIVGLAFLGGLFFALITFGPVIIAGLISILAVIWPFLLWGFLGLLTLGILINVFEKLKNGFKAYPWQLTIIIVAFLIVLSIVIVLILS